MPRKIEKTIYKFDELSDEAKEKAREWYREGALDYDWWDYQYEDAERAGLKISEFDLDRNKHVKGSLIVSADESIRSILSDHGEDCETHKTAKKYQADFAALDTAYRAIPEPTDEETEDYEDKRAELEKEYEYALCEEYASLLQNECDYLLSDEAVDESITANEYEFNEDGSRA